MRRVQLLLLPVASVALVAVVSSAGASSDPASVPTTTATAPSTTAAGATTTTVLGAPTPTSTIAPVAAPARSGSSIGDLEKNDASALWSTRQIATVIAAAVGALAVIGYAYGRIRSYGT